VAAILSISDRIATITGGNVQQSFFMKDVLPVPQQGVIFSLWAIPGLPGAAANPTTVAAPTRATLGAIAFTNPTGGRQKWLVHTAVGGLQFGSMTIYDRLLHIGGLSGTITTAQTVGGALTRYTNGVGNLAYFEVYTDIGSSSVTATLSYTNDLNNAATATIRVGGTNSTPTARFQAQAFPLNAGEKGVKAVTSVTLSSSTGTAGNFGITVGHPLMTLTYGFQGFSEERGSAATSTINSLGGDVEILSDACLAMLDQSFSSLGTTEHYFLGMLNMVEK